MRAAASTSSHLQHGDGIADISHDRQPAETGDNLAQEFQPLAAASRSPGRQAGDVAARPRQARDQPLRPGRRHREDDRDDRCRLLCRETAAVPAVTMTSTLSRTNSAAISASARLRPSAQRYSIATVRPSTQPSSRSRCTKGGRPIRAEVGRRAAQEPDGRQLPGCCARAASGHATAAPPSSVMNSRRFHSITSSARGEQRSAARQAERLGGLEVDDQLELGRLHHRQVGRLVALEDPAGIDADLRDTHP